MITHDDSIKEIALYDIARKAKPIRVDILRQLKAQPTIRKADYKAIIHMAIVGWFHENARFN